MLLKYLTIISIIFYINITNLHSEVEFDGTMNPETKGLKLSGKFEIKSEYGKIINNNLFHSFKHFNIEKNEKAIFIGDRIQNIINRVTGGDVSHINGTIESIVDGANIYLINPAGIVFNKNARLNVRGSFHATTADYLIINNNEKFQIDSENPILFSEDPYAFGFFENTNENSLKKISINECEYIRLQNKGKSISFISNEISISQSQISAPEGRINIAAVIGKGVDSSISLTDSGFNIINTIERGKIEILNLSEIITDGDGSGDIFILGGDVVIKNQCYLLARTEMNKNGSLTLLDVDNLSVSGNSNFDSEISADGNYIGGKIIIKANQNVMFDNSTIKTDSSGGTSGAIEIFAKNISILNNSVIRSDANMTKTDGYISFFSSGGDISMFATDDFILLDSLIQTNSNDRIGNAGNVLIKAQNINLKNGAEVFTRTRGQGIGGNIILDAKNSICVSGINEKYSSSLMSYSYGDGDAGNVNILAKTISFKDGGMIISSAYRTGNGGDISIVGDTVELNGYNPLGNNIYGFGSHISSTQKETINNAGKSGDINITADILTINEGALISNSTSGDGESGIININTNLLNISGYGSVIKDDQIFKSHSGIYSRSETQEPCNKPGGIININSSNVILTDHNELTSSTTGKRNAGDIILNVNKLYLDNQSIITSGSKTKENGGAAGRISIYATDFIKLNNYSSLTTEATNTSKINNISDNGIISIQSTGEIYLDHSSIITSVNGGTGNGGDIDITPKMIVMNKSNITANAYEGNGGNIRIIADHFIKSQNSIIEASSEKAIDGLIDIQTNTSACNYQFDIFNDNYLDISSLIKNPCDKKTGDDMSVFVLEKKDGFPPFFDDCIEIPILMPQKILNKITDHYLQKIICDGIDFFDKGFFKKAILSWKNALSHLEHNQTLNIHIKIWISYCYKYLGYYSHALKILNNIKQDVINLNDLDIESFFYAGLGDIYLFDDKILEALDCFKKSCEKLRLINNPELLSYTLNNYSNALFINGNYLEAISYYLKSIKNTNKVQNINIKIIKAACYINLIYVKFVSNENQNLINNLDYSLNILNTLPDSYNKACCLIFFGSMIEKVLHSQSNKNITTLFDTAINALNQAESTAKNISNYRLLSLLYGYMGKLYETQRKYSHAIEYTRKAIFFAQHENCFDILYLWQWQLGKIFKAKGDIDKSILMYEMAISTLNPIRLQVYKSNRDKKNWFQEKIRNVYIELARQKLKVISSARQNESILYEVIEIIDKLKESELQNFYLDECIKSKEKKEKIELEPDTAIIYSILFSDQLISIITTNNNIEYTEVPIAKDFPNWVHRFSLRLRDEYLDDRYMLYARLIYDVLIKPIEKKIIKRKITTLIFSPDGLLRMIPFSALHDGRQFLIEKYALATIPAINLTDLEPQNLKTNSFLLTGLSNEAIPPLPGVKKELNQLKSITGNGLILLDEQFSIENFKYEMRYNNYSNIVISTHGVFGNSSEESFLKIYNGKLTMNDVEKIMNINRIQNHKIDLLTLSACNTASGNERAALGFAGITLKAGVRSALATLWPVNDEVTYIFMCEFYKKLIKDKCSKAKIIQEVQKKLIFHNEFNHPYFWSPYVLIGNWK